MKYVLFYKPSVYSHGYNFEVYREDKMPFSDKHDYFRRYMSEEYAWKYYPFQMRKFIETYNVSWTCQSCKTVNPGSYDHCGGCGDPL